MKEREKSKRARQEVNRGGVSGWNEEISRPPSASCLYVHRSSVKTRGEAGFFKRVKEKDLRVAEKEKGGLHDWRLDRGRGFWVTAEPNWEAKTNKSLRRWRAATGRGKKAG